VRVFNNFRTSVPSAIGIILAIDQQQPAALDGKNLQIPSKVRAFDSLLSRGLETKPPHPPRCCFRVKSQRRGWGDNLM